MVTVQLRGRVQEDGTVVLVLPPNVRPDEHDMVLVLSQEAQQTDGRRTNGVNAADAQVWISRQVGCS